jgi:hypothetical protein
VFEQEREATATKVELLFGLGPDLAGKERKERDSEINTDCSLLAKLSLIYKSKFSLTLFLFLKYFYFVDRYVLCNLIINWYVHYVNV